MKLWLIEPRDPLIFRDGRPFNATPGARAVTLPFPYPSTLAGVIRTRAGWTTKGFAVSRVEELKRLAVRGPFLVELTQEGNLGKWLFPAPADALLLKSKSKSLARRVWLRPVRLPAGVQTKALEEDLLPVSANPAVTEKPYVPAPRFWEWEYLQEWLTSPHPKESEVSPGALGLKELPREERIHVHINTKTGTALEKHLFQTVGLSFVQAVENGQPAFRNARFFALAITTEADFQAGVGFVGGERRIAEWRPANGELPHPPAKLKETIVKTGYARLMLVTPGHFQKGYLPSWLKDAVPGLNITVIAAALPQRPQVVSGWDFEKSHPKPSRRLVPAGSVYFLKLEGNESARKDFVERLWLAPISDAEQDRLDGFGLALVGAWDGLVDELEVKDHA
ncbi:MAG: type III-B CRISPR module-associated protein Cmr3 [Candidatus Diapherotrites archaeon]|nr:type III-B CRISPR module-associated protein Cmr3 [Candidatus Diapherotrites archaeon]